MIENNIHRSAAGVLFAACLILTTQGAYAQVEQPPPFTMRVGARVQIRMTHLALPETDRSSVVHIRRGRLSVSGAAYEHFNYTVQIELAGSSAHLIDAFVQSTLSPFARLWFGQGKAYFGRQQLTSSGSLHFVDRTIVDGRFAAGRQQGIGLTGRVLSELVEYNVGVYNGNGINQRTNPSRRFMPVGRLVVTPFGAYTPGESAHDYPASPRLALGVAAMENTIGDGTSEVDVTRFNTEAAFKLRGLNMTAEFYREMATADARERIVADGWYYQAGFLFPGSVHEIAGRYATIRPETLANLAETGIAYSYYFRGHSAKLQVDFRNIRNLATGNDHREFRMQFQLAL